MRSTSPTHVEKDKGSDEKYNEKNHYKQNKYCRIHNSKKNSTKNAEKNKKEENAEANFFCNFGET